MDYGLVWDNFSNVKHLEIKLPDWSFVPSTVCGASTGPLARMLWYYSTTGRICSWLPAWRPWLSWEVEQIYALYGWLGTLPSVLDTSTFVRKRPNKLAAFLRSNAGWLAISCTQRFSIIFIWATLIWWHSWGLSKRNINWRMQLIFWIHVGAFLITCSVFRHLPHDFRR
jgi:hypothetical protein